MKNLPSKTFIPYLSWSRMSLYERDPKLYEKAYILGESFETEAMSLGKKVALARETRMTDDKVVEHLKIFFPQYPKKEYEVWKDKRRKQYLEFEGIPIFGVLDGFDPKKLRIGEDKTGVKWTQGMVDKLGQLTFQSILVLRKFGRLPTEIKLNWGRTEKDKRNRVRLTGDIKIFQATRTMTDIIRFYPRMREAWFGINEIHKEAQKVFV